MHGHTVWQGSAINGTDGTRFSPLLSHHEKLQVFSDNTLRYGTLSVAAMLIIHRSATLAYNQSLSFDGMAVHRFVVEEGYLHYYFPS